MEYTFKIGGEAGQGVQTIGEVLSSVFARAGHHVFTNQDYESRVRGGHNFYQIRVSNERVISVTEKVDIIIALDMASIDLHKNELREHGVLAYDSETLGFKTEESSMIDIPFKKLAVSEGGNSLMANTVATGAVLGMLGSQQGNTHSTKETFMSILENILKERFAKKGEAVQESNIKAARSGFEYAKQNCKECRFLPSSPTGKPMILIDAIEAAAVGALASGCKFYAAYPMTPSTGIMNNIAARAKKFGVVVEQAEDEISAINMALGASFAGVRSATGSSGGGFALMVEGVSLAGMTETPVVIFESQRPGPATGFPTRTEQGDLSFILNSGHGEFPRAVFAPGSPAQALYLTNRAFEISERYQITSFVLLDQYLADAQWTYEGFDASRIVYNDYRLRGEQFSNLSKYKRHALTPSGVSPLAIPGDGPHVVVTDSDEHDEDGHIVEDALTRIKMTEKRLFKKLNALKKDMAQPVFHGRENPETVLVGWGSTYGVLRETVDLLNKNGANVAMLFFNEIYPLPEGEYLKLLEKTQKTYCIEGNATGQFASLFRMETGFKFQKLITRYDGRPFTADYIMGRL